MHDLIFAIFTISIVTGLIYLLYKIMLGPNNTVDSEKDLQISAQEILQQITILYRQKKYNIVESLAKKYLEKKPSDDDIRTILAKSYHHRKKESEAIDQIKIILKHQPKNSDMKILLATCLAEMGTPMKAVNVLEDVLEHDRENVVAMKELAEAYLRTNQKQSAIKMYKRLEEFLYSNQEKINNKSIIAEIHTYFKEYSSAIKEYQEILEIYPEDDETRKKMIELFKITSDYESLIRYATEMYRTDEGESALWAMKMLMDTYCQMQDYDKALEFAELMKQHPLSRANEITASIAHILLEKGQVSNSIDLLESLVISDPQNISLQMSLAKAYEKNKDYDSTIDVYKKILDLVDVKDIEDINYKISTLYAQWGMVLFAEDNYEECFKRFGLALKHYDRNPDIYCQLGNVNKLIKNCNEAITQYKKAIELDPQNALYYQALAGCYEEIDSIYEQKKALVESLKHDPLNARVHYKLGLIYKIQNDFINAISSLKKSIELDPMFTDAKYKLGLLLEHQGDKEEAIDLYEDILKIEPENEEIRNTLNMLKAE